jgi:hypothetical protein
MPANLNRRAILAGAAATAMPTVAIAAVNTSPDHELLMLRPPLLQAHEAMEAAIEAFNAIHDPIDEAAWLEAGVAPGAEPQPGDGERRCQAMEKLCAPVQAEYTRLDHEMHAAASRYDGIARQIMATPAHGREGLAVKALVVKHWKERLWEVDPWQLAFDDEMVRKLIDEILA